MHKIHVKIILVTLVLLAIINIGFYILSSYTGTLIGIIFAIIITIHWWIKRNSIVIIITSTIWFAIHIYELFTLGLSSYPVLFFLNLILPIPLFYFGLREYLSSKGNRT